MVHSFSDTEVLNTHRGRPSILAGISHHEECVVKQNNSQSSFKGAYGWSCVTVTCNFASTSNILSCNQQDPLDQHIILGDINRIFAQRLGACIG